MLATQTIVLISFGTLLSKLLPASLLIQPCVPPKRDEDYVMLCYVIFFAYPEWVWIDFLSYVVFLSLF